MTNAQATRRMASEVNVHETTNPAWGDALPKERPDARIGWRRVPLWRRFQILGQALELAARDLGRL